MITGTAGSLAQVFGLKPDQVRVLSPFVGGGFGGKGLWSHQILAAAAAKLAGRPVRLVLSREGVYRLVGGRTTTEQRVALGAGRDGTLDALIHTGVVGHDRAQQLPRAVHLPGPPSLCRRRASGSSRRWPTSTCWPTPGCARPANRSAPSRWKARSTSWRTTWSIDPIELRRRWEPERDPTSGSPHSPSRHLLKAYADGAARFGWERRDATPRPPARRRMAGRHGRGHRHLSLLPHARRQGARCGSTPMATSRCRRRATRWAWAPPRCRPSTPPTGWACGCEHVSFEYGDSRLPAGAMAGGSSQTAGTIAAVTAAADALLARLLKLAGNDSPLAGLEGRRDRGP